MFLLRLGSFYNVQPGAGNFVPVGTTFRASHDKWGNRVKTVWNELQLIFFLVVLVGPRGGRGTFGASSDW
jgi:hypothetical protein